MWERIAPLRVELVDDFEHFPDLLLGEIAPHVSSAPEVVEDDETVDPVERADTEMLPELFDVRLLIDLLALLLVLLRSVFFRNDEPYGLPFVLYGIAEQVSSEAENGIRPIQDVAVGAFGGHDSILEDLTDRIERKPMVPVGAASLLLPLIPDLYVHRENGVSVTRFLVDDFAFALLRIARVAGSGTYAKQHLHNLESKNAIKRNLGDGDS